MGSVERAYWMSELWNAILRLGGEHKDELLAAFAEAEAAVTAQEAAALREQPEARGVVIPPNKDSDGSHGLNMYASGYNAALSDVMSVNATHRFRSAQDVAPPSAPVGMDPPVERQRDMLAQAIRDAAVKAGIARADASMTGPMLLMLCDDMADCILTQQPAQAAPGDDVCWCLTCRPQTLASMRFVVCPICGNKRCPRANDHRNACTASNEPGQKSSAFATPPGDDAAGVDRLWQWSKK